MLEIKNVSKYYGDLLAVDNISFNIEKGSIFGLLGSNGAGKTTTFKMIMGLLKPSSGEILLNGEKVSFDNTDRIGYLIEERSIIQTLKVKDQLTYLGKLKNMSDELINSRIDKYLDFFEIPDFKNKKIKELSKGNQQKIQFMAAVLNEPELLILDEPFSGLDPFNVELLVKVIKYLQSKGSIIIFSSHQMSYVEEFCEELLVLQKGKAVLSGNINDIKDSSTQKTIKIVATVDEEILKSVEGVIEVTNDKLATYVLVSDKSKVKNVFEYVKTLEDVIVFEVVVPSLHKVYVEKVGNSYEE